MNHLWYWVLGLGVLAIASFAVGGAFMHKRSTSKGTKGDHTVGLVMLIVGCAASAALIWRLVTTYMHHNGVKQATERASAANAQTRAMLGAH